LQAEVEREAERQIRTEPPPEVLSLCKAREAARASQDWTKADSLRDRVAALGWLIEDTPEGSQLVPLKEEIQ
jgi:cysteinyl-tRNA synthetase